jgi:hypothetical protein
MALGRLRTALTVSGAFMPAALETAFLCLLWATAAH